MAKKKREGQEHFTLADDRKKEGSNESRKKLSRVSNGSKAVLYTRQLQTKKTCTAFVVKLESQPTSTEPSPRRTNIYTEKIGCGGTGAFHKKGHTPPPAEKKVHVDTHAGQVLGARG